MNLFDMVLVLWMASIQIVLIINLFRWQKQDKINKMIAGTFLAINETDIGMLNILEKAFGVKKDTE